ncbi:hypothetical protein TTHERM_00818380 (macronuclear) [Tetrahymena thermophila SB210]|uniref:Transmembrane protein n=1 Tax=Tetrahymena thermophila (strain SB210) TaxID=312017 RepID=Q23HA8_TETTS|nr:hypothetical protein TTHERM_00818380 [Tetrahymena thermophila SB210]EAR95900.1 hypothetical protein TTHERM_00818380 [Tetrahymena thermophila SB210]|eukprot:XP_001016145.1 hypothetical protein TTHERM_00818380 [Tetrahymena thermophila SB210]
MKLIAFLLIIAITTVNASQEVPQCVYDLLDKAKNNQICQQGDTACISDLRSLDQCSLNCLNQNQNKQPQTFNCVKSNCKPTNPSAQAYFDDLVKCQSTAQTSSSVALFSMLFALIFLLI